MVYTPKLLGYHAKETEMAKVQERSQKKKSTTTRGLTENRAKLTISHVSS